MENKFFYYILTPFTESVYRYEKCAALNIAGEEYTYRQLGERVSAIRCAIRCLGAKEQIAGIAVHDDIDTYAAIFALWMEGLGYVPLHPNQPIERNKGIVR